MNLLIFFQFHPQTFFFAIAFFFSQIKGQLKQIYRVRDNRKIENQNKKKTLYMSNDFKVYTKKLKLVPKVYQLYLLDLSIFFQINFDIKVHFYYFLVHNLKDEKERLPDSNVRERKILLAPISVTEMVDLYVKWFRLMIKV
jgi:hypothetical protein